MKATQCKRGHERTDANVYIEPRSGARLCRICRNERKAEWARANRNPAKPRASRAKGSPAAKARPIEVGRHVWLVRDGVRNLRVVVGYRGDVLLLGRAS